MKKMAILLIFLLLLISFTTVDGSKENEYGKWKSYYRFPDENGEWGEWIQGKLLLNLKQDQIFQIMVNVETKQDINVEIRLYYRFQNMTAYDNKLYTYEIINGSTAFDKFVDVGFFPSGTSENYTWTIKQILNTSISRHAGLHFGVSFINDDYKIYGIGEFILNHNKNDPASFVDDINNEDLSDQSENDDVTTKTPGFELILFLYAFTLLLFYKRRK